MQGYWSIIGTISLTALRMPSGRTFRQMRHVIGSSSASFRETCRYVLFSASRLMLPGEPSIASLGVLTPTLGIFGHVIDQGSFLKAVQRSVKYFLRGPRFS